MSARLLLSLLAAVAAALALAGAARATAPEVGIADDRVLLAGGPAADSAVGEWAGLGVEVVRIHALWGRIAPDAGATRMPAGFDPANPDDPRYDWAPLDAAVARVRAAGMRVMLTVTGPGPLWASDEPERGDRRWRPDPARYAEFATAVARRYRGRIERYILWNEPNLPLWLMPQSTCHGRTCTPASPHLYRALVRAAYPAIRAADPGAPVLLGALGPLGSAGRSASAKLRPLTFLRTMGCVDARYRKVRTGPCRGFHAATGDGFAYHPHSGRLSPSQAYSNPDDVDLASLPHLEATLDRLQRMGALHATSTRFALYLDEYGYQTNPPDRMLGVPPATQDSWLQEAAYRAWRDPRVRNLTQYVWIDEPVSSDGSYSGWQSGLRFASGAAKPALAHFAMPFFLDARRSLLWGQMRRGSGPVTVTVQRRTGASGAWTTIATVRTDGAGAWSKHLSLRRGASYRFASGDQVSASARR